MDIVESGLVLRAVDYKEYHRILTVLTGGHGIVTVTARNVRRKTSPLKACAQMFAFSEMTLYDNRGRYSLTDARPIEQFYGLSGDLECFAAASYIAEVLMCEPEEVEPEPELFRLALNSLYALSERLYPPLTVKAAFELRYAGISGLGPNVDTCQGCGEPLKSACARIGEGALYCQSCASSEAELSPSVLSAIRYVLSCDIKKLFSFELPPDEAEKFRFFCEEWLKARLERNFKTLDFLRKTIKG